MLTIAGVEVIQEFTKGCGKKCLIHNKHFLKLFEKKFCEKFSNGLDIFLQLVKKGSDSDCMECYCRIINNLLSIGPIEIFIYPKDHRRLPIILKTKDIKVICIDDEVILNTGRKHPATGKEIVFKTSEIDNFSVL